MCSACLFVVCICLLSSFVIVIFHSSCLFFQFFWCIRYFFVQLAHGSWDVIYRFVAGSGCMQYRRTLLLFLGIWAINSIIKKTTKKRMNKYCELLECRIPKRAIGIVRWVRFGFGFRLEVNICQNRFHCANLKKKIQLISS